MAKYRKLGRTSSQRKALIRNQVTALLNNGKIVTTEAKAKEIRKTAEGLIALAVKEKDNFDEVTVTFFPSTTSFTLLPSLSFRATFAITVTSSKLSFSFTAEGLIDRKSVV